MKSQNNSVDPVLLRIMIDSMIAIPEEMGRALRRTAYSPNIKERMDASCALFDHNGELLAQAEHIPVHLGSMPIVMKRLLDDDYDFQAGDIVMVNDPGFGGTHLPDITVVLPVYHQNELVAFALNRAHHADIGGITPGSMPASSTELFQEGLIIPPVKAMKQGKEDTDILKFITSNSRTPLERLGDLRAQFSACFLGERRYRELIGRYGLAMVRHYQEAMKDYSQRAITSRLATIPLGTYGAVERMDLDRMMSEGGGTISEGTAKIEVSITVEQDAILVDFSGTDPEMPGNHNAPEAVTRSAVYYVFRCISGTDIPNNEGCFHGISIRIPRGSLLSPQSRSAVCSGNVETSQRIVEVLFKALSSTLPDLLPAGSQGTMNNVIIGSGDFSYYETIGGGEGAYSTKDGEDGIHTHMTNTSNTPVEAIEMTYPLRIHKYTLREGSGGIGRHRGGEGIIRDIEVLTDHAHLSILSGNRNSGPQGRGGGGDGKAGMNRLIRDERIMELPALVDMRLRKGDVVSIATPGGGGWGSTNVRTVNNNY